MVKIVRQAGQKCTLNKPLYCPKNEEHLRICKTLKEKISQNENFIYFTTAESIL